MYALRTFVCEECGVAFQRRAKQASHCSRACVGKNNAKWLAENRPRNTCSVDDCERKAHGRGYCLMHLKRVMNHGSTETLHNRRPEGMSVYDWFMSQVEKDKDTGCWNWCGPIMHNRGGYGKFYDANKCKKIRAHHFLVPDLPPAPPKMEYDHLCGNVLCVNPEHLEMVTATENRRRQHAARRQAASLS